jgi:hypothetical protein
MKAQGIHHVDYKKMNKIHKPTKVRTIPPGIWLPVSIAAYLYECSTQTIHLMRLTQQIAAIKLPRGPILVDISVLKK